MHIHLVVNPKAARGAAGTRIGATIMEFEALGVPVELHQPASAADARSRMRGLASAGAERVVIVGGDGMVHQAVNALADSDTALGIISAGTGNDSARALKLPTDIADACAAALEEPAAVDLISGPNGLAMTVATLGFGVAVNERADRMRFPRGGQRYSIATLIEMPRLKRHQLTLTLDGVEHEIEANLVAIANTSHFGGGMKIAPDADPTDGMLDVVVIGPAGRAVFSALLPTVFSGRHVKSRHVALHRAAAVSVAGETLPVRADGEELGSTPTELSVRPSCLLVAGSR